MTATLSSRSRWVSGAPSPAAPSIAHRASGQAAAQLPVTGAVHLDRMAPAAAKSGVTTTAVQDAL